MPDLEFTLKKLDLRHLYIIAELWGLEFSAQNLTSGVKTLVTMLLNRQMVEEMIDSLPLPSRDALKELINNDGSLAWSLFTRRYGMVREVGVGRRDREQIYLKPSSPAEILWYRGLIGRDFFDTPSGPQEFAYIPSDLLALIPSETETVAKPLGHPATAKEYAIIVPTDDRIIDHACTLLAHLRLDLPIEILYSIPATWPGERPGPGPVPPYPLTPQALTHLLLSAGMFNDSHEPWPDRIRDFLEAPRAKALEFLVSGWLNSPTFNELLMLPGMAAQGEWENDPLQARNAILDYLATIPNNTWWSLTAFVGGIKEMNPDFQRPAGDYDTWFIRDVETNEFLRGFENWERVDGTLVRFILGGPLHWLGIIELGAPSKAAPANTFRITTWAAKLLKGQTPEGLPDENQQMLVQSDARLQVPRLVSRSVRYQIARSCTWEGEKNDAYLYHITPGSLEGARNQGIQSNHLLALLQKHAKAVPPSLVKALQLWEQTGSAARIEQVYILRVRDPKLIPTLRKSRAARFLGDSLGPTTLMIKPGSQEKVLAILAELGYLGEIIG
jgi:hypothetical protein